MKNFSLTAKYDTTWYDDRDVYSSGNDLLIALTNTTLITIAPDFSLG
jgi:hypothetical protein